MAPLSAAAAAYNFDDADYLGEAHLFPDWAATLERQAAEKPLITRCLADAADCDPALKGVRHLLLRAQSLEPDKQIRLVNRYVNKRRYRRDRAQRKVSQISQESALFRNRWSTVLEFLKRGGDCEDFATAKYFLLRSLGFPSEHLRVVVAYDRSVNDYHALLAVRRPSGATWLLESDNSIRRGALYGYKYVYAVNENAIWDHEGA